MPFKVGTFTANTSTGNQAITGVGFQPDAVILIGIAYGALDTDNTGTYLDIAAASDGTTDRCYAQITYGSSTYHWDKPKFIAFNDSTGSSTLTHDATLNSLDSDGFTINWSATNSTTLNFMYIAIEATNAKVLANNVAKTSTGTQAYTGAGFQPNLLFCFGGFHNASDSDNSFALLNVGWGNATANWNHSQYAGTGRGGSHIVAYSNNGGGTYFIAADIDSLDSDGFTLDFTIATSGTRHFQALCLEIDDDFYVGFDTQPTTDTTKAVTGVGFQPDELFLWGSGPSADPNSAPGPGGYCGCGWTDGTNYVCSGQNSYGVGDKRSIIDTDICYSVPGRFTTFSHYGEATHSSWDSDGFTLDWDSDGTARYYGYLAVAAATSTVAASATTSMSLAQTLTSNISLQSASSVLALAQELENNITQASASSILSLIQAMETQILTVIEVETVLALQAQAGRTFDEAVTTTLSIVLDAYRKQVVETDLGLASSAFGYRTKIVDTVLAITQTVAKIKEAVRTVTQPLNLVQNIIYFVDKPNLDCIWSPFSGPDGIDPTKPTLTTGTLTLEFGATTLTLRNPEFDNIDEIGFQRIRRQSLGGTVIMFADPNWPKTQRQRYTITRLNQTQVDDLQSFVNDSLAQLITLTDHHGTEWSGIITTPDIDITDSGHDPCRYTVSFDFEGEEV